MEINKKILGTRSERVKKQLRAKYVEKSWGVKRSIKTDKKKWMENITCETEEAARNQHMKTLYGLTKILCNENLRRAQQCWIKVKTFSIKKEVQVIWTEHFKNCLIGVNQKTQSSVIRYINRILVRLIEEISASEPSLGEVKQAIKRLKNTTAPGTDSTTAELSKANILVFSNKNPSIVGKSTDV